MRREEIVNGVNEVISALEGSGLPTNIRRPIGKEISPEIVVKILASLRHYTISASNFSNAARQLVNILGLEYLESAEMWVEILVASDKARNIVFEVRNDMVFATEFLPRIAHLVKPQSLGLIDKGTDETGSKYNDRDILSIIIIEEGDKVSSPERLIEVLESINTLYRVCATMLGIPPEGLSVIGCDSGSDKSFDFLGAAKVIECLKEFILSMWDRVVFFREKQLEERIELVNKSLPVYERIAELVTEKKLEPEMGEILRRKIFEGTSKFIKAGVTIPEIEKVSIQPPRALMAPEPKLLVSAPEDALGVEQDNSPTEGSSSKNAEELSKANVKGLSDEEQMILMNLLKKVQQEDKVSTSEGDDTEYDVQAER
ncbi:MAG TPA: hypothetical protein VD835_14290 [Pyrinomonadaceae bacterium]|nr:hypothetical protein [Pyrinomonadaceae bacterium]